jgi:hypothetical protein
MTSIEAYNILLKRQISEDRILAERTRTFLLATAFLFMAFVMLLDPDWEDWIFTVLRIALPIVGIFMTFLLFSFNQSASIALDFWHKAQCKIEQTAPDFYYMRSSELTPHVAEDEVMAGEKEWLEIGKRHWILVPVTKPKRWWQKRLCHNRVIYRYCLPPTFLALWLAGLAVAIARIFS